MKQIKTFDGTRTDIEKGINKWLRKNNNMNIIDIKIQPQFGWIFLSFVGGGSHDKHIGYIVYER